MKKLLTLLALGAVSLLQAETFTLSPERLLDRTPSPVFPDEEELNRVESGL